MQESGEEELVIHVTEPFASNDRAYSLSQRLLVFCLVRAPLPPPSPPDAWALRVRSKLICTLCLVNYPSCTFCLMSSDGSVHLLLALTPLFSVEHACLDYPQISLFLLIAAAGATYISL